MTEGNGVSSNIAIDDDTRTTRANYTYAVTIIIEIFSWFFRHWMNFKKCAKQKCYQLHLMLTKISKDAEIKKYQKLHVYLIHLLQHFKFLITNSSFNHSSNTHNDLQLICTLNEFNGLSNNHYSDRFY